MSRCLSSTSCSKSVLAIAEWHLRLSLTSRATLGRRSFDCSDDIFRSSLPRNVMRSRCWSGARTGSAMTTGVAQGTVGSGALSLGGGGLSCGAAFELKSSHQRVELKTTGRPNSGSTFMLVSLGRCLGDGVMIR